jgi:hypothetical protein
MFVELYLQFCESFQFSVFEQRNINVINKYGDDAKGKSYDDRERQFISLVVNVCFKLS